jgi:hypothetical protein
VFENPGLGRLLLRRGREQLRSDLLWGALLAFGDQAQRLIRLDVQREDAFAMQPGLDIPPDDLPSVHNLIL